MTEKNEHEEYEMNGSVGATEAATLALLTDTARAGNRGYGYGMGGEGGCGGSGPFAGPSSNAVRINAGNRATAAGIENLLDQNQFAATNKNIVDGHNRICDNLAGNVARTSDMITNQEFRNGDRLRDIEREISQNARVAAKDVADSNAEFLKCCCETQKLVVSENSATRDLINQNTIRAAVDQNNISATVGGINAAAAANTAAIIAAIQGINSHHRH